MRLFVKSLPKIVEPKIRDREPGMIKTLRYTISYIRFNFFAFLLNVLTIGIAGVSILAFGYLAYAGYQEAKKKLDVSQAKKIVVSCLSDERFDESRRFNAKKIEEVKKLPWVDTAIELVRQQVYLSIKGIDPQPSPLEGTVPHDPEIDPMLMEWGRNVSSEDAEEIVVTSPLLADLCRSVKGSSSTASMSRPDTIQLTVRHTAGNEEKDLTREYQLVGILNSKTKRAFIPLQRAKYLEMWCSDKINDMPEVGGKIPQPEIEVKAGRLYTSNETSAEALEQARKHFQIELKEIFSCHEPVMGEVGELRVTHKDNAPFLMADVVKLQSMLPDDVNIFSGSLIKANLQLDRREVPGATLQAFAASDPRLKNFKMMDGSAVSEAINTPFNVVVSKNLVSRYLPYGIDTQPSLLVDSGSFKASLMIVGATENFIGDAPFDALCSLDTLGRLGQKIEFNKLCLVVITNPKTARRMKDGDYQVEKGQKPKTFPIIEKKDGWGFSDSSVKTDYAPVDIDHKSTATTRVENLYHSDYPSDYCAITMITGDRDLVRKFLKDYLSDTKSQVIELSVVDGCKIYNSDKTKSAVIAFCNPEDISSSKLPWAYDSYDLESGRGLASEDDFSYDYSIKIGENSLDLRRIYKVFPPGYILFSQKKMSVLLPALQQLQNKKVPIGEYSPNFLDVIVNNPVNYGKVKTAIEGQGLAIKEVHEPKSIEVSCFEFNSKKSPNGTISRQLMDSLKADRTFLDVCPNIEVKAVISGLPPENKFSFVGSFVDDRLKINTPIKFGTWLLGESINEVVLSEKVLVNSAKDPKTLIGKSVTLVFEREAKRSYSEPTLDIECIVSGVTSSDVSYMSLDLVKKVYLWQVGRMPYNERKGTFVSSEILYDKSGHESCKIYVKSVNDVRPAVSYIRNTLGYDTEDYLKDQERVRELGKILFFLVAMIVIGSVISGILNVLITTLMNTKTRIYEIGVLRAHGASNKFIKRIFFQLGLIMGVTSFIVAFSLTPLVIELISFSIKTGFSVELGKIMSVPFLSADYWWLYAIGLVITVIFCLFGVFWSAMLACKTPIVKALISRE